METIKTGEKVRAILKVSNENDGTTGNYTIRIYLKDSAGVSYLLMKNTNTNEYDYVTSEATPYEEVKEYMKIGTSYEFKYESPIPDSLEGKVQGKVEIWDENGATFIVGTDFADAYIYQKKKFHLALSLEFQKV